MIVKQDKVWLRIAGNAYNIRNKNIHHWRCFVNKVAPAVPLVSWNVVGKVDEKNFVIGTSANGDVNRLVAWIDLYGDIEVDNNDVATVILQKIS